MSTGFRLSLIWLLGGTIALFAAFSWLPSVFYDGDILPTGHDSFYHASRILNAVGDPMNVTQFDPRIRAPEGAWVPWPWGYDALRAWIAGAAAAIDRDVEPMRVLVYVPAAWTFVTAGLILGIAGTLGLNLWLRLAAVLCFAFSPLTQDVHGLGRIDHHFFEYTYVLMALLFGLRWLQDTESCWKAAVFGLVLGTAPAFHNGLFVLQVPFLAAIALMWLKGRQLSAASASVFSAILVASTIAIAVPSAPFREGFFAYHLLSWFHLYIAFCTAACVLLFQRLEPGRAGVAVLATIVAVLLVPVLIEARSGLAFVGTEIVELKGMPETRSVFGGTGSERISWWQAWQKYSGLVLLLPVVMLASIWRALSDTKPDRIYFYVSTVFGAALLLAQYRFHTFGSFSLYLPLLLWWQWWLDKGANVWRWAPPAAALTAAYAPAVTALDRVPVPGYSYDYVATRSVYPPLAKACAAHRGVVLANHNDGHYIRFHTECSVIANNLILTNHSREKIRETRRLFALAPNELRSQAPWVTYVLALREDDIYDEHTSETAVRRANGRLRSALLLDAPPFPDGYRLLRQVALERSDGSRIIVARLFRIER